MIICFFEVYIFMMIIVFNIKVKKEVENNCLMLFFYKKRFVD